MPVPISKKKKDRRTYFKRKRGLLKKCIEMSLRCKQDVYMVIYDKKAKKLVEFNSTPEFDHNAVTKLMIPGSPLNLSKYCN